MGKNLLEKIWDLHKVAALPSGQDQIFIGLHICHEVTSPQAFQMIEERRLKVLDPERTVATVDHIVPTDDQRRPFADPLAEEMMVAIEENTRRHGIRFFGLESDCQGISHIIGPELGLSQPGMVIVCGDSHTSTHGAVGALAFGIGTSQIRDVLATQTLALSRPKVRRIEVSGHPGPGVHAKDIILRIITDLGVTGGMGYAYEYAGPAIEALDMEGRLTICNMSIEGGARAGYVNPDRTTFDYLEGRMFSPKGEEFARAVRFWKGIASDPNACYDDLYALDAGTLEPMVAWGITPAESVPVTGKLPRLADLPPAQREGLRKAFSHTSFREGTSILGQKVDLAFIGSCTNARIGDLRAAARIAKGRRVAPHVRALVVPGSKHVLRQAEKGGLHEIFLEAGFEWRQAGCSMCIAMNPDRLEGDQVCASSSNRNYIGRQGSPKGRTLLMSPAMAAAAALAGEVVDVRGLLA